MYSKGSFMYVLYIFFFKQKTAYEMRISDWSSDVCSSDLLMASAKRGDQRLVAVVMGDTSENQRAVDAQALLNWGFRFYESHKQIGRASCRERVCQYVSISVVDV